jgi:site-specific recombinase XerD
MLEQHFVRPQTVDRIRASWVGPAVEQYADWLMAQGYAARNLARRVPLLLAFGAFARARGAASLADLPAHLEAFVAARCGARARRGVAKEIRGPVEQWLRLVLPGFAGTRRPSQLLPFAEQAPGFFTYLRSERGLRPATLLQYTYHLHHLERYCERRGLATLRELTPALLTDFLVSRGASGLARVTVRETCGVLRVFLRYGHREALLPADLSLHVGAPQAYRLAHLPRAITPEEVRRLLEGIDRRAAVGKRDYALLLLLVTYGLRAREAAALTLDDVDWPHDRLRIPARKADHSTAYPLAPAAGAALVDYLQHGRPATKVRQIFCRAVAPHTPLTASAVAQRVASCLHAAGVRVPRAGSHTLRHTCIQRLVEADFPLKVIGDYVGHRSPAATAIYAKVAVETLRQVADGAGEEVLA